MSAIDNLTPVPDQPEISEGNQTFHAKAYALYKWMREKLAPAILELRDMIVNAVTGAFTGSSTTSITILDTGEVSITTDTGRSFKPGTPVRLASVVNPLNFIDGVTKTYDSSTGAFVFFAQAKNGSGTFANWSLSIIPSGGGLASLGSNTFTGNQFVPDDDYDATGWNGSNAVPTKNAIRDKIESIVQALFGLVTTTSDSSLASDSDTVAISSKWGNKKYLIQQGAVTALSGASVFDFAAPAGAKEITLHLDDASLSVAETIVIQLGTASGPETSNYVGGMTVFSANTVDLNGISIGIPITTSGGASVLTTADVPLVNKPGTNTWTTSFSNSNTTGRGCNVSCKKALAGPLTLIRLTKTGSTGTFDNGSAWLTWRF